LTSAKDVLLVTKVTCNTEHRNFAQAR